MEQPAEPPDQCPECGTTTFDYDPAYSDGVSASPAWLCTGCRWGIRATPIPPLTSPEGDLL